MTYNNEHWHTLITTIVDRIGADAFLRLSSAVLQEHTRGSEEIYPQGKDKDEWKHEAVEAMRLKR
jgi:hypothetical protein